MHADKTLKEKLLHKINFKTKPLGALGQLETLALQIGLVQETTSPQITNPHIVVFAADHGIAATGLVNPYPQAVTAQMVLNFVNGGAAINVFCRQNNIALQVVDAGVNIEFDAELNIIHAKIAKGTNNYLNEAAMSQQQCLAAIEQGKNIVVAIANQQCNCIGFGEMGIGNTSSASLIMSAILGIGIAECTGRGTGSNDEQLKIKIDTLQTVFDKHQLYQFQSDGIELLCQIGGFEIAMMVGAYCKAASLKMVLVVDGFIATAALLVAKTIATKDKSLPAFEDWCLVYAHASGEFGHQKMLDFLQAKPLLNLGMRLGEGTGAALAIPLIQATVNFLNEMASFETAGVSEKEMD